jgi:hypothetical protein
MWPSLIPIIGNLIEKLFPDPTAAANAKLELLKMQQAGELAYLDADLKIALAQAGINQEEAKSTNWWVAGARPAVMWICAFALAYASILEPFARFAAKVWFGYSGDFPLISTDLTLQILMGILGLGAARTVEKIKNSEGNR